MYITLVDLNFLTLVGATVISFFVGALWYSPLVFGNLWAKLSKIKMPNPNESMWKFYLSTFVLVLMMAFVMYQFIILFAVTSIFMLFCLVLLVWVGFFVAGPLAGSVMWEGKPFTLFLINAGYWLVNLFVMSLILYTWG